MALFKGKIFKELFVPKSFRKLFESKKFFKRNENLWYGHVKKAKEGDQYRGKSEQDRHLDHYKDKNSK